MTASNYSSLIAVISPGLGMILISEYLVLGFCPAFVFYFLVSHCQYLLISFRRFTGLIMDIKPLFQPLEIFGLILRIKGIFTTGNSGSVVIEIRTCFICPEPAINLQFHHLAGIRVYAFNYQARIAVGANFGWFITSVWPLPWCRKCIHNQPVSRLEYTLFYQVRGYTFDSLAIGRCINKI